MNERVERLTMSVEDAAAELGVSTKMAYDLIHVEGFPVLCIGHRKRVNREGLKLWIDANTQGMEALQQRAIPERVCDLLDKLIAQAEREATP